MLKNLIFMRQYTCYRRCSSVCANPLVKGSLTKLNAENNRTINTKTQQGPSKAYLQVLGSGAHGSPSAFYIQIYDKRYYFNCGEGFGRLFLGNRPIVKETVIDIFFTSRTWSNIGGLPGLSLTLDISKYSKIILHGPEALDKLFKPLWFVLLKNIKIEMAKHNPGEDYEDDNLIIKYVHLRPHNNIAQTGTVPNKLVEDGTNATVKHTKDNENIEHGTMMENDRTKNDCHIAYICKIKKESADLVSYTSLAPVTSAGPGVLTPHGQEIVIIVLEVPDVSYLDETEFAAHFDDSINAPENVPAIIVHCTPSHVFNNTKYRKFMSKFGPATKHLVLNSLNSCLGSKDVHELQHKLHLLHPNMFPLLSEDNISTSKGKTKLYNNKGSDDVVGEKIEAINKLELIEGRTLTTYHLRPNTELDRSTERIPSIGDCVKEVMKVKGFISCLEEFRRHVSKTRIENKVSEEDYPKVIFLGTNSSVANRTRNTSAIVLQISQDSSMLLDCGEGTFTQMVRFFGRERVNAFLRTLKAIYVSHLHLDHHFGLIGMLQARRAAFQELSLKVPPLQLLAPWIISHWMTTYDRQFQKILDDFILVPNEKLLMSKCDSKLHSSVLRSTGVQHAVTCDVIHCPSSFGVALQIGRHKITYSGDTCPCDDLVKIGQNSTLLIHEATLEDELVKNARFHSTTSQAIRVGRQMGAKHTILTHFSPRYRVVPRLEDHVLTNKLNVGIAFDFMQLSMSDLEILPHMYAPLKLMFSKECEYTEKKSVYRTRQMLWK